MKLLNLKMFVFGFFLAAAFFGFVKDVTWCRYAALICVVVFGVLSDSETDGWEGNTWD